MANTAVTNADSRRIFAPMFRARWQNMQNVISDAGFLALVPAAYKIYYTTYIQQWVQWSQGFVPQLHRQDFFSTGMGYTVCDILTKECMSGGYRIHSNDRTTKEFFENWEANDLNNIFNRMYFHANATGNAILTLTPVNGELYPAVYPSNRAIFKIGRSGEITDCVILNRFVTGEERVFYAREHRIMKDCIPYYKVDLSVCALATVPDWNNERIDRVPECIAEQWSYCYGDIMPCKWYRMPEQMRNIGCYNVRNKAVAVALADMPGYSDSSLHTALDVLYSIDYNYTQSQVDMFLGKSRTLVPKQMQPIKRIQQPGTLSDGVSFREALEIEEIPLQETFYTQIGSGTLDEAIKPMFIQPDLRGEIHKYIRDADLELLASKVGLSGSTLASHLSGSGTKTDDEIYSESSSTEKTVGNKRELANTAINAMLADVAHFYGISEDVDIQWNKFAQNSDRENQTLLSEYQAGVLPLRKYLSRRWTDMSEEDIEQMAQEIEAKQQQERADRQNMLFGDVSFNDGVIK